MNKFDLKKLRNVIGVGEGIKWTGGKKTDQKAVTVFVTVKVPRGNLRDDEIIPSEVDEGRTDVIPIGRVKLLSIASRTRMRESLLGGISVSHSKISAGTLGVVCWRKGDPVILSNEHVIAPEYDGATVGDPVFQPGNADVKDNQNIVGYVDGLGGIDFHGPNLFDAAISTIDERFSSEPGRILQVGKVLKDPMEVSTGDRVRKFGRTSGLTEGEVLASDVDILVDFGFEKYVEFTDQIIIMGDDNAPFVRPGDSGSLCVSEYHNPVGLVFAGGANIGVVNRIQHIMDHFNLNFGKKKVLEGYIGADGRYSNGEEVTSNFDLHLRSNPTTSEDNIIAKLPKDTPFGVVEYGGYSDNYYWLRVRVLE